MPSLKSGKDNGVIACFCGMREEIKQGMGYFCRKKE
jgi:hypothetical protein